MSGKRRPRLPTPGDPVVFYTEKERAALGLNTPEATVAEYIQRTTPLKRRAARSGPQDTPPSPLPVAPPLAVQAAPWALPTQHTGRISVTASPTAAELALLPTPPVVADMPAAELPPVPAPPVTLPVEAAAPAEITPPRKRGRPRKAAAEPPPEPVQRKRGRPPKAKG